MSKVFYTFFFVFISIVQFGLCQDSLVSVKAEQGDGIYSLLRKQGLNPYAHFDDFVKLNIANIRDSIHIYEGRLYKIPPKKNDPKVEVLADNTASTVKPKTKGKKFPIFGEKYQTVTPKSERLKGTIFYVVSGHGGPDPGAMTNYKSKPICEDEYAYDISLRLARELLSHGAMVYIIIRDENDGIRDERVLKIDHDEVAYPDEIIPLNQVKRLKQRANIVNKLYKKHRGKHQRLIVTHVDSRSKGQNIDAFFYHHENSKSGKKLAENIHATFQKKYKKYQPNRIYDGTFSDRTGLYMVRNTSPATVYIEIGNIKNKKDQRRILEYDNRQALAKWISEGAILDYESK